MDYRTIKKNDIIIHDYWKDHEDPAFVYASISENNYGTSYIAAREVYHREGREYAGHGHTREGGGLAGSWNINRTRILSLVLEACTRT